MITKSNFTSPAAGAHLDRMEQDRHMDPDTWLEQIPLQKGSWWPAWLSWLGERSGGPTAPPPMGRPEQGYNPLGDAPGTYVMGE